MSKLTKFEALQLAAILATRREYNIPYSEDAKDLFDLAEAILEEDKNRNPSPPAAKASLNM
ncbi:hypothetical protein [Neisseria shayeganii]|uniref:MerR family bacterial regulatory protein n=1 Tax=Neisseria shayeganii 871 TaxID=1032488 RepID=G4CG73_9NEIS|nr:hypothetical protein [Neisseria shayeganii]EGY53121.1 MerR family bacterial regulatory protein [Neisseria shayeganii 871]